ncbi:hypothetical protein NIES4072_31300 [Nostoc commune NIES-4072]|uniref:Transmembrane protein n=1 Tax=Nostoc commune NIES-4072 TaxID=2005467 RepID=A0A2R5FL13_NOSCO|nr:hypothetical protein NIES4070_59460 [Nostoc commune HK-02]GBG19462.1 hypothetical protein NIES4072_31300 [Nostoc commune NIES-4072]
MIKILEVVSQRKGLVVSTKRSQRGHGGFPQERLTLDWRTRRVISCFCAIAVFIIIVPLHLIFAPLAKRGDATRRVCTHDDNR